jgi:hypothetical protein
MSALMTTVFFSAHAGVVITTTTAMITNRMLWTPALLRLDFCS